MIKRYLFLLSIILCSGITINAQTGWFALSSGTGSSLNGVDFMTTDYVIAVGDDGMILRTTDGGTN